MFSSVRAKLTLWYTGIFALVLVFFAITGYSFFANNVRQRMDETLAETMKAFVQLLEEEYREMESESINMMAIEVVKEFPYREQRFIVYDESFDIIATSTPPTMTVKPDLTIWSSSLLPAISQRVKTADTAVYFILPPNGGRIRAFVEPVHIDNHLYRVVVLQSFYLQEELLEKIRYIFYIVVSLVISLIGISSYFLVGRSLAPVVTMSEQATRISAANLHERLPIINRQDELGQLATVFNDLLTRLAESFEQQRRFMADASHELRTPISIVCGEAEVALSQQNRAAADYQESLAIIQDEGKRLSRIVEDLFTLARADAGQYPLIVSTFYLDELISDCVRAVRVLATSRNIELCCQLSEELRFRGDEALIRRLVLNLLDNAIKYTPVGGNINIICKNCCDTYHIEVADSGCGIPLAAQAHIFERFYRVDKSRSRLQTPPGGAGLGLSIARWIAEAHQGCLELRRSDQQGSIFVATLPIDHTR
ncbi:MAG: ATP-binding protein [Acidobacteriota bacterium]